MSNSGSQMQKAKSTHSVKMISHLIPHVMQVIDLAVRLLSLSLFPFNVFLFASPPQPSQVLYQKQVLEGKINTGRHSAVLATMCARKAFSPCSVPPDWKELELQYEGRQAACETSASFHHSWPCLCDFRQKTSVFIWRLLRHLIQLEIKGKRCALKLNH